MKTRSRILFVALATAVAVAIGAWYLVKTDVDWMPVTNEEALTAKSVVFEPELNVYVVSTPGEPLALSAKVPHERTDYVRFCPRSGLFESDFLGAKFDRLGIYYGGPGERSLDRLESKVEDGIVYVNPDEVKPGPARGERDPTPPKGNFCSPT